MMREPDGDDRLASEDWRLKLVLVLLVLVLVLGGVAPTPVPQRYNR